VSPKLCLDSSAIVKRYVTEPGSATLDEVFDRAEVGRVKIAFSLWNVGEVLGTFDERHRRGWLEEEEFNQVLREFADENLKLLRLKILDIIPLFAPILADTWTLILSQHIYEADAIQISTSKYSQSEALLSADRNFIKATRKCGLKAVDIERDGGEVKRQMEER